METYPTLYVDGDVLMPEDGEPIERVSLAVDDNGVMRKWKCRHCGEELEEDGDGWEAPDAPMAWRVDCSENFEGEDGDDSRPHEPEPRPLAWVNHAAIELDEDDDAVHVSISVGDPRGAFTFTVRRLPDSAEVNGGRLIMHTPHPGEGWAHEKLTELHSGTYLIGG